MSHSKGGELLEMKDRLQNKPIHICAQYNSLKSMKQLLLISMKRNNHDHHLTSPPQSSSHSVNYIKSTPLHVAAQNASKDCWKLLVDSDSGVSFDSLDVFDRTPEMVYTFFN